MTASDLNADWAKIQGDKLKITQIEKDLDERAERLLLRWDELNEMEARIGRIKLDAKALLNQIERITKHF